MGTFGPEQERTGTLHRNALRAAFVAASLVAPLVIACGSAASADPHVAAVAGPTRLSSGTVRELGSGASRSGPTGAGVTAYVIDTGIRSTHHEFGGRVGRGFTAIHDGRGTADCDGHGTHVAGIIGGSTYGVAPAVRLIPVRVLDCSGEGTIAQVIAGIDWVTTHHQGPAVANLSLTADVSPALDAAVARSIASGVTYVLAAGNDGANACASSPGRLVAAITVGASIAGDRPAKYSNRGPCVDLFAAGSHIRSATNTGDTDYAVLSGTSQAAPHVTGVIADYLQGVPRARPGKVFRVLLAGRALSNQVR